MFATRAFTVAVAAALLLVNGAQGATVVARTVSPDPGRHHFPSMFQLIIQNAHIENLLF